jgi:hypothetical protein
MTTITKKREGQSWRLFFDGRRTALSIWKGPAPRYREPQDYDLIHDQDEAVILTAASVGGIVGRLETLAAEFNPEPTP